MIQIHFDPSFSANQNFRIDIGGQVVKISLSWNIRDSAWYMDITSDDNAQYSVKLLPYTELLFSRTILGITGNFFVLNEDKNDNAGITFDNFGSSYYLYWFDADDLSQLEA